MKEKSRLSEKWVLLIFVGWALFLSFEFWGFGPASYVKIPDSADADLAARLALPNNLKVRENGLWNADLLAGVDRVSQAYTLGVFDVLFLILPGWLAYGFFLFLQRFIAGYFTFKILNRQLALSFWLSLFPALFFSLYSQNQINLQFDGFTIYDGLGLPAIPMILYVLGHLAASKARFHPGNWLAAFALGLVFANVSTFIFTIFFFPLIVLWLTFMFPRTGKAALWISAFFVLGWISLEGFEIAATYSFAVMSQRTLRDSCTGVAVTTFSSLGKFLPYYVLKTDNIPALLAGLSGVLFWRKKLTRDRGLVSLAFLGIYIAAGFYLPRMICSPNNPFGRVKGFNYSRFYFYFPFLISVVAGLGLQNGTDYLISKFAGVQVKKFAVPLVSAFLIFFTAFVGLRVKISTFQARLEGSNYANIFMNPYLEYLATRMRDEGGHYRAVTLNRDDAPFPLSPAFLWPYGINTLDGYTGIYSLRFAQYWNLVLGPMMNTYPQCRYGLKLREGNSRVLLSAACDIGSPIDISTVSNLFDMDLLSLAGARYFVSTYPLSNPSLEEIDTSTVSCSQWIPACTRYFLYENKAAFPFVFTLSSFFERPEPGKVLNTLGQADLADLLDQAYLLQSDISDISLRELGDSGSELKIIHYSSDQVSVGFSSLDGKIVVFNWNFSPDWRAWVDGETAHLFPVDHFLVGVYVPPGVHQIELRYLPKYSIAYWVNRVFNN